MLHKATAKGFQEAPFNWKSQWLALDLLQSKLSKYEWPLTVKRYGPWRTNLLHPNNTTKVLPTQLIKLQKMNNWLLLDFHASIDEE